MSSRNMASWLSLAIVAALAGTGCAAQTEPASGGDGDEQALASPEGTADPASTTRDEATGEAKDACFGGWGGCGWGGGWGGWGGWGGGWGGFWPGLWGGGWGGFWPGLWGGWGGFGGCGLCGGWGGGWW